ncbi:MAG: sigma-E processing peptidase SpoIIGA [Bacillota bacterium]
MLEVYGEYLFLENLIMNWFILYLTAYFSKIHTPKFKIWIGAVLGALYAFVVFFPSLSVLCSLVMKIIFSMFMIVVTFTPYKFKDFFKALGIFYLISFMFGGAAFALFYLTDFKGFVSNGIFYVGNISIKILLYSGILSFILIKYCWEYIQVKISRDKMYIPISIEVNNVRSEVKALIDTGNSLQDPLSKYPVIIVEYSAIKEILPIDVQLVFENTADTGLDLLMKIIETSEWMNRFRLIPFKSLGREHGMLVGFKPDCVKLMEDNNFKNIKNIIIGIYTKRLSTNGDYSALLHPDILI